MGRLRGKLTYSNVMVTLLAFVMLSGGAAYAASHLGKKTVGAKQLKPNAVTSAKIKNNAVTGAKIKNGAVTGAKVGAGSIDSSKIADGAVTGTDINVPSTPFSRIVFETRGNSSVELTSGTPLFYPLNNPTYTQSPGSDDAVLGALDFAFKPSCEFPRSVAINVFIDPSGPAGEFVNNFNEVVASGSFTDPTGTAGGGQIRIGGSARLLQPSAPTNHTLAIWTRLQCSGGTGEATATFGALDVIGTKK
jgi:hypothetical protein